MPLSPPLSWGIGQSQSLLHRFFSSPNTLDILSLPRPGGRG